MTNQEQYELICEKAKKYDRLVGVMDKIRAEIESNRNEWIKGEDAEWHTYDRCLLIIDKYKAEREEK